MSPDCFPSINIMPCAIPPVFICSQQQQQQYRADARRPSPTLPDPSSSRASLYFTLSDLWAAFDEWSAYGTGVPMKLPSVPGPDDGTAATTPGGAGVNGAAASNNGSGAYSDEERRQRVAASRYGDRGRAGSGAIEGYKDVVQYYVPFLSAVQLFASKGQPVREEGEAQDRCLAGDASSGWCDSDDVVMATSSRASSEATYAGSTNSGHHRPGGSSNSICSSSGDEAKPSDTSSSRGDPSLSHHSCSSSAGDGGSSSSGGATAMVCGSDLGSSAGDSNNGGGSSGGSGGSGNSSDVGSGGGSISRGMGSTCSSGSPSSPSSVSLSSDEEDDGAMKERRGGPVECRYGLGPGGYGQGGVSLAGAADGSGVAGSADASGKDVSCTANGNEERAHGVAPGVACAGLGSGVLLARGEAAEPDMGKAAVPGGGVLRHLGPQPPARPRASFDPAAAMLGATTVSGAPICAGMAGANGSGAGGSIGGGVVVAGAGAAASGRAPHLRKCACEPPHLLFQHFETASPYCRMPLADQVAQMAAAFPGLMELKSSELHPASWFAVAWYPIYSIPVATSDQSVPTSFLTYHSISVPPFLGGAAPACSCSSPHYYNSKWGGGDHGSRSTPFHPPDVSTIVAARAHAAATAAVAEAEASFPGTSGEPWGSDGGVAGAIPLPAFGLASYKLKPGIWYCGVGACSSRHRPLELAATQWLRRQHVRHPDHEFFAGQPYGAKPNYHR
eukprot:jgi/Mesvir1/28220/Mv04769-RA.1